MPELPEIETLKRTLEPRIVGARVERVVVRRRDVIARIECHDHSPRNRKRRSLNQELLERDVVVELHRHGKQLALIGASGRVMCFHLGMSGQVRLIESANDRMRLPTHVAKHVHCVWRLSVNSGGQVCPPYSSRQQQTADSRSPKVKRSAQPLLMLFRDPRRFGGIWTAPSLETLHEHRWNDLGPDALAITSRQLAGALLRTTRCIKAALLDQSLLAGVGNIYADEALFRAGIHPLARANELARDEIHRLTNALRAVLRASIRGGGTTFRDYVDANGTAGGFVPRLAVYGRGGERCLRCNTTLVSRAVSQRTTVFCPACQRKQRTAVIHTRSTFVERRVTQRRPAIACA